MKTLWQNKGEIAHFEQFLLLSQRFQKLSHVEVFKSVYMWERVKFTSMTINQMNIFIHNRL